MITKTLFDSYRGRNVYLYELANEKIKVGLIDFGAAIQYIKLNAPQGERDVCLGFDNVKDYIESGIFCGATIGRVANRIEGGAFTLGGREYKLPLNDGKNHLHGGAEGFDKRFYEVETGENSLTLSLISEDGDMGYGGELKLKVKFEITESSLRITYSAVSDRDTVWAPTCHAYFNFGEDIRETMLRINAKYYTPVNAGLVPTGEILPVKDTPFDFTSLKAIGRDIDAADEQLKFAGGYDHNFVLDGSLAAEVHSADGDTGLEVYTDMPGLQFYSGNFIKGNGKNGKLFPRDGFCLEPQFFPNAVNTENFKKPRLAAKTEISHYICYKFSV